MQKRRPLVLGLLVTVTLSSGVMRAEERCEGGTEAAAERVERFLRTLREDDEFNGVVVAAQDGVVVYRGAIGLGNAEWDAPLTIESHFVLGTLTSTFTEALVAQLVGEESIDAEATLQTYVPDSQFGDLIIKRLFRGEAEVSRATAQELMVSVLEAVAQKSYRDLVLERIVRRFGLEGTEFVEPKAILPNRANGYVRSLWGKYEKANIEGDGAVLYITAPDLRRWHHALFQGEVVAPALIEHLGMGGSWQEEQYSVSEGATRSIRYARGEAHGFTSLVLQDDDRLIALTSNVEGASLLRVGMVVSALLGGLLVGDLRLGLTTELETTLRGSDVEETRRLFELRRRRDPTAVPRPDDLLRAARAMCRAGRRDFEVVSWLRFATEVYPDDTQLAKALGQAREKRDRRPHFQQHTLEHVPVNRERRVAHVLRVLDLSPGQVVADIGCGDGWLSAAAAEVVGERGRVYAVEIKAEALERVRERNIANVIPVLSDPGDTKLPRGTVDVAFLHDVATHVEAEFRPSLYSSIHRALASGGVLVVFGHHGRAHEHLAEFADYGFVPQNPQRLERTLNLDALYRRGIHFRRANDEPGED